MATVRVQELLGSLERLSSELSHSDVFRGPGFETGLVRFSPRAAEDSRFITHQRTDVVAYVLEGRGVLRLGEGRQEVGPGMLCHIPAGTPHDFVATLDELVLLYTSVRHPAKEG